MTLAVWHSDAPLLYWRCYHTLSPALTTNTAVMALVLSRLALADTAVCLFELCTTASRQGPDSSSEHHPFHS
jgi:hypothetical protein